MNLCSWIIIGNPCYVQLLLSSGLIVVVLVLPAMATWTLEDVVRDMQDVANLLAHKKGKGDISDDSEYEQNMITGILSKIDGVTLTPNGALMLYQKLDTIHSFSPNLMQKMKDYIDNRVSTGNRPVTNAAPAVKPQHITVANYLSKTDWDQLQTHASYHYKVSLIVKKLRALGVQSMSEQSCKHSVATLLCCYKTFPEASTIFQMVQDFKLAFNSTEVVRGLPVLIKYPLNPRDLPTEIYEAVYNGQEAPMNHCPDQFTMVAKQVPMRMTNKLIKKDTNPSAPTIPLTSSEPSSSSDMPSGMNMAMQMFNMMMEKMTPMFDNLPQKRAAEPKIEITPKKLKVNPESAQAACPTLRLANPIALPLEDKPKESAADTNDASLPTPATRALDIEAATFAALQNKASAAKAKANPKKQPKAQAKGKAKGKAACKRPAAAPAAVTPFNYVVGAPGPEWVGRTIESWTSKHYHTARKMAVAQGLSDEESKVKAREARKKACELWTQYM